jgi:hypothetical protein
VCWSRGGRLACGGRWGSDLLLCNAGNDLEREWDASHRRVPGGGHHSEVVAGGLVV